MLCFKIYNGRVRGLVLGDTFRRLLSRTLAQTFGAAFDAACAPHQFALSTRAGAEALTRAVRARLALDDQATIVSIDGVGAYDHVSRAAILAALHQNPHLTGLLPYVRQFYSSPSSYVWYDRHCEAHHVAQGEGGEQGDPLMPCLFAAALHPALTAIQQAMAPGDGCLAFLDDVYLLTRPERAVPTFRLARDAILRHAGINLHQGKTRVWNKAGSAPANIHTLQPVEQNARIWVGDQTLPPAEQGLQVLGAPIGSLAYIEAALARTTAKHAVLFERITAVPDLQCAYLLLTYCANTRATYLLRALPPILTQAFATAHDAAAAATLAHLLGYGGAGLPDAALVRARLPFRCGGLGLQSATDSRHEAHWASWADTLPTLQDRLPGLADHILHRLGRPEPSPPMWTPQPCATPGSQRPHGRPSPQHRGQTQPKADCPTQPAAGNVQHATPETTPSSQRSFPPSTQRGAHSCCPRQARTPAGPLPHSPRPSSSASRIRSSESSCCDASGSHCPTVPTPAPVAARWTPSATIAPPAHRPVSCGPAPRRSSGHWRASAARRVHASQRTCPSAE